MDLRQKIIDSLNYRCAVKKYDPEFIVNQNDEELLLESLNLAPSSFGLQPYSFEIIKNKSVREKIKEFGYGQEQFTDSSFLVVVCVKTEIAEKDINDFIDRIAEVRNQEVESLAGYKNSISGAVLNRTKEEQFAWASKQSYIAVGFMLETAALLGIDVTPMEGFDSDKVTELLNLSDRKLKAVAICSVGQRSENDTYSKLAKVRKEKNDIFNFVD